MHCVADFCLVPMGVDTVGVTKYIAECQKVLEKTGLVFQLHGYGTGLEGEFSEVTAAIQKCHEAVHAIGCPRIATDIRIGTRTDKKGSLERKVGSVKELLAQELQTGEARQTTAEAPAVAKAGDEPPPVPKVGEEADPVANLCS